MKWHPSITSLQTCSIQFIVTYKYTSRNNLFWHTISLVNDFKYLQGKLIIIYKKIIRIRNKVYLDVAEVEDVNYFNESKEDEECYIFASSRSELSSSEMKNKSVLRKHKMKILIIHFCIFWEHWHMLQTESYWIEMSLS